MGVSIVDERLIYATLTQSGLDEEGHSSISICRLAGS